MFEERFRVVSVQSTSSWPIDWGQHCCYSLHQCQCVSCPFKKMTATVNEYWLPWHVDVMYVDCTCIHCRLLTFVPCCPSITPTPRWQCQWFRIIYFDHRHVNLCPVYSGQSVFPIISVKMTRTRVKQLSLFTPPCFSCSNNLLAARWRHLANQITNTGRSLN